MIFSKKCLGCPPFLGYICWPKVVGALLLLSAPLPYFLSGVPACYPTFMARIKSRVSTSSTGVAPGISRRGADSSDEGAKIWFSEYYKCQKSPKKSLFTFRRGL